MQIQKERKYLLEEMKSNPYGIEEDFMNLIPYGIVYHHSGIINEEREIIERAFKKGTIILLFATSTLAVGVNLPAYRVIFNGAKIGNSRLDIINYKQMSGRAGRKGLDLEGYALFVRLKEWENWKTTNPYQFIAGKTLPMNSQLKLNSDIILKWLIEGEDELERKIRMTYDSFDYFLLKRRRKVAMKWKEELGIEVELCEEGEHEEFKIIRCNNCGIDYIVNPKEFWHYYKTHDVVINTQTREDYENLIQKYKNGFEKYPNLAILFENNKKNKCFIKFIHKGSANLCLDVFQYDFYHSPLDEKGKTALSEKIESIRKRSKKEKYNRFLRP